MRAAAVGAAGEPPRVAYAVGRAVGTAVVRNRVRRRMRAAVHEHREWLRPGWGYLARAGADAATASYRETSTAIGAALHAFAHEGEQ